MADTFTFTNLPNNTILLKNGKEGSVSLTVTNVSGRSLEATTSIELTPPDSPAKPWIRVEPATTIPLPRGGTTHFRVFITVPEQPSRGEASFKLVVADDSNPHEAFNASPDVAFSWEGGGGGPRWPLLIATVVAVLVVVGIIAAVILSQRDDTPHLEPLEPLSLYGIPDTTRTPMSEVAVGEKFVVVKRISGQDWYQLMMDNGTPMWVKVSSSQARIDDIVTMVATYAPPALTPTPMPTSTYVPTATFAIELPTDIPTALPTIFPTFTPTTVPRTLSTQFTLADNTVDYYIQLAEPGSITVKTAWDTEGGEITISILDSEGVTKQALNSILSGDTVEYTVSPDEWNASKIWHVQLLNNTGYEAMGNVMIIYPSGSQTDPFFKDRFNVNPYTAEVVVVAPLSAPGTLSAQITWGGASDAIEAGIRLPYGNGFLANKREASGMTVTYDVPDLAIGDLWVVNLVRQTPGPIPGTLTLRYP